jgi:hypothetical protein
MGLLGVARANTAVGVSPETFLLLLLLLATAPSTHVTCREAFHEPVEIKVGRDVRGL